MMAAWIGCGVSISCDESLGCYQGTIIEADGATITLTRAFRNGFPYPKPQVTLKASDIKDIQIIDPNPEGKEQKKHSTVQVTKGGKKFPKASAAQNVQQQQQQYTDQTSSGGNSYEAVPSTSQSLPNSSVSYMTQPQQQQSGKYQNNNYNGNNASNNQFSNGHYSQKQNYGHMNGYHGNNNSKSKPIDIQGRSNRMNNGGGMNMGGTPNKKDRQRRKNEACFGTPNDDLMMGQDFDFEKNLALFDKRALWEELNQAQKPDAQVAGGADPLRRHPSQQKYRHDENILTSQPTTYRAISVPAEGKGSTEYVTDDGLVIPSITRELRGRIIAGCAKAGLGGGEVFGRAGAEVTLQLLGGTRRLHPRNNHQVPTVAFLVGPHRQGAVGVTCARHLASHGVSTVVLVAGPDVQGTLRQYLNVYQMTGNKLTTNILDLPSSVDLIIIALCEDSDQPTSYPHVAEWISQSRAPVLALDPPAVGTPGITTKYSLIPILPLNHSEENGKLYLCNLAIPKKIFTDVGVQYNSPFGSKFVIPLHPNDS